MRLSRMIPGLSVFIALVVFTGHAYGTTTLKLGTPFHSKSHVVEALGFFSKILQQKSDGGIHVKVYPNAEFGGHQAHIEAVSAGAIDMAVVLTGALSNRYEELQILDLPFLFSASSRSEAYEKVNAFLYRPESKGKNLFSLPEDAPIRGLVFFEQGLTGIATKESPIML